MIDRKQLINSLPSPTNKDVIIYNVELKELIDENVIENYYQLLPSFLSKKEDYLLLKKQRDEMANSLNKIYLFNNSWSEEDYLIKLGDAKKTYSILFNDTKKMENELSVLKKKIEVINEKIEMQNAKENKQIEQRKNEVKTDIEKNKLKLAELKDKRSFYNNMLERVNRDIENNQDEFEILQEMQKQLETGECTCKYCGRKTGKIKEGTAIFKRFEKNLMGNKKELETLLKEQNKIELEIASYTSEILKVKAVLNNDIQFKKEENHFYLKKSIQILKLEALRDELINNAYEIEKKLKNNPDARKERFIELKKEIEKYEVSLENLKKIKENKIKFQELFDEIEEKKQELIPINKKINQYIEFIKIYFKIYEQKLDDFFGSKYKFKLFEFEDVKLKEILKIEYNGIDYENLPYTRRNEVDRELAMKISIYD